MDASGLGRAYDGLMKLALFGAFSAVVCVGLLIGLIAYAAFNVQVGWRQPATTEAKSR